MKNIEKIADRILKIVECKIQKDAAIKRTKFKTGQEVLVAGDRSVGIDSYVAKIISIKGDYAVVKSKDGYEDEVKLLLLSSYK
jgi:hypothetical protein